MSAALELRPEPLSAAAFEGFGDVIEAQGEFQLINEGTTRHFADRAAIDVAGEGGRPQLGIYRTVPARPPMPIRMLERHPLGSQCFMPLARQRFLVVVAPAGGAIDPHSIRAFVTNGRQGVNYRRGTWHHPLIALGEAGEFLVIDRGGDGANCDQFSFARQPIMLLAPEETAPR